VVKGLVGSLGMLVVLTGCGSGDSSDPTAEVPPGCEAADSGGAPPPLRVRDAVAAEAKPCAWVRGFLHVDGGVRLCEALGESDPPSCGRPTLEVSGLDSESLQGLTIRRLTNRSVSWSEDEVVVLGDVAAGSLQVRGPSPIQPSP
jgi:hypothetical protein